MRSSAAWILLALSAALHGYLAWRLLPLLPAGPLPWLAGAYLLASALLLPLPLLARIVWQRDLPDALSGLGFLAMGVFSFLFVLSLLRELLLLLAQVLDWLHPDLIPLSTLAQVSALAVLALSAGLVLIGYRNARKLARVVQVDVPIAGLPEALHGFAIAQISDIHVGPTIKHDYLHKIVQAVNALNADLVAVTGDVVDGSVAALRAHVAPLAQLRARHGVYAVTGNHEYYSGAHDWIAHWRELGLSVLLNEHAVLEHEGERLLVAGVTDYSAHVFHREHRSDPHQALAGAPADIAMKLLLAHQPRSAERAAEAGFHLQLSGHTHGGQFLPWNFFVPLQQPFIAGLKRWQSLWVYTSRGTGYWGPPLRLGAPAEITHLRLVRA